MSYQAVYFVNNIFRKKIVSIVESNDIKMLLDENEIKEIRHTAGIPKYKKLYILLEKNVFEV
ncbi:hypothetical protein [Brochothrix campestris]|uniref:Uncharacterized protein n=1 Tax=Brochothrix campestris FSL F6-1037 TaxID=1265861 RepID=W7CQP3_9LIST|nr:hypothetical protein [Brochothrix campestris]EUJ41959.1 hypothetical protein BCAMP_01070 [Brochothrix campestris FSL F6-1037]